MIITISSDKKKTAADGGSIDNGIEKDLPKAVSLGITNTTIEQGKRQEDILTLLPRGVENAISSAELMSALGIQNKRTLAKIISRARGTGAVILASKSGRGGYFLPDTGQKGREEIIAWQRVSSAAAINTLKSTASANSALKISPQQIKMEEHNGTKENV